MTTVVIGCTGQVAGALREQLPEATFLDRKLLDLSNTAAIRPMLERAAPDFLINAAAYTAVDRAEDEPDTAMAVNGYAVREVAAYASEARVPLVHLSTDYVFDGTKVLPYVEDDPTSPLGAYGRSKLAGEQFLLKSGVSEHWIIRTSWVFSERGSNFVKTILRLAGERDQIGVVEDQRGIPTYAGDIARALIQLQGLHSDGRSPPSGIYHLTSGGPATSWHGFAKKVFQLGCKSSILDRMPNLTALSTAEYPTRAPRPSNSVLDTGKLRGVLELELPDWSVGLRHVLNELEGA